MKKPLRFRSKAGEILRPLTKNKKGRYKIMNRKKKHKIDYTITTITIEPELLKKAQAYAISQERSFSSLVRGLLRNAVQPVEGVNE